MLEMLVSWMFVVVLLDWVLSVNFLLISFMFLLLTTYDAGEYTIKLIFFMLSIWLTLMMMISVDQNLKSKELFVIIMTMLFFLKMAFYSETMIMFYMSFEMSIIPIFLVVLGWGYQPDRVEASLYMLMYTVFFSLPFLVKILYFQYNNMSMGFLNFIVYMMVFLVKLPMVGLHYWLPRAHVEAPMFGSMILAGVMLKLGGYGIFKVSLSMGDYLIQYNLLVLIVSLMGGVYLSGVCFVQSDMKMLVAYSSIVHMSLVLCGLLTLKELGLQGAVFMMLGHGLCSSGLFCALGLIYKRSLTRSILLNSGFLSVVPSCSFWWFLFCSSNLSFPPCLNLPGELFLFISILSSNKYLFMLIAMLGVLSSLYSIYLFSFSQQSMPMSFYSFYSFTIKECLLLSLHWLPLNLLVLDLSLISFY